MICFSNWIYWELKDLCSWSLLFSSFIIHSSKSLVSGEATWFLSFLFLQKGAGEEVDTHLTPQGGVLPAGTLVGVAARTATTGTTIVDQGAMATPSEFKKGVLRCMHAPPPKRRRKLDSHYVGDIISYFSMCSLSSNFQIVLCSLLEWQCVVSNSWGVI